jgi:hypothetical protein
LLEEIISLTDQDSQVASPDKIELKIQPSRTHSRRSGHTAVCCVLVDQILGTRGGGGVEHALSSLYLPKLIVALLCSEIFPLSCIASLSNQSFTEKASP